MPKAVEDKSGFISKFILNPLFHQVASYNLSKKDPNYKAVVHGIKKIRDMKENILKLYQCEVSIRKEEKEFVKVQMDLDEDLHFGSMMLEG